MNDEMVRKLHDLFARKMQEVHNTARRQRYAGDATLDEINAWQHYLNKTLSLEVVDIEQGGQPGVFTLGGRATAVRIMNPSNAVEKSREFIVIPYEIAEKILAWGWIPDDLRNPDG